MFDKIIKAFEKKRADKGKDQAGLVEAKLKERLSAVVYDPELVEELMPAFMALSEHKDFEKVIDLLESKEKQIETIVNPSWLKQESIPEDRNIEEEDEEIATYSLVETILKNKYREKQ